MKEVDSSLVNFISIIDNYNSPTADEIYDARLSLIALKSFV